MIHSKAPVTIVGGTVNVSRLHAAGAGEIVRPRRLMSASARPLNFTVLDRPRMARRNS